MTPTTRPATPGQPIRRRSTWLALAALLLPIATSSATAADSEACHASHRLVITEARIVHEPGDVTGLASALAARLERRLEAGGHQVVRTLPPTRSEGLSPAMDAFARHAAPYFLRLGASDVTTEGRPSRFLLVPDQYQPRAGQLQATLDDGAQGARLATWRFDLEATGGKPFSPDINAHSERFWETQWGRSLDEGVERLATGVLDTIRCRPLVGRVLSTQPRGGITDLRIDLGREDGLRGGDRLMVVEPGVPVDWLGVNLLTRPSTETTAGPVREPQSLGMARITYLGERDSTIRYTGRQAVESGDLVLVRPQPQRLKRLPD
ncbi:hypothetical protein LV476_04420 [Guyparkeria hydrothermalis]|uniref:hypothetical protein n=1 Tax=Guyparkeria hydrothermalis TaxID=923 RepID=UPI002022225D|nr:hypothetical protein [Guyparkeria hydrothermalis]MCL7744198.1 hypothetical protein [Guyparkeria hydrothermalis]